MKVSFFLRKPQADCWMSDFCKKRCVLEVKQPQNHHFWFAFSFLPQAIVKNQDTMFTFSLFSWSFPPLTYIGRLTHVTWSLITDIELPRVKMMKVRSSISGAKKAYLKKNFNEVRYETKLNLELVVELSILALKSCKWNKENFCRVEVEIIFRNLYMNSSWMLNR